MIENIKVEDILCSIENVSDNYQECISSALLTEKIQETKNVRQKVEMNPQNACMSKITKTGNEEEVCIKEKVEIWGNKNAKILVLGSLKDTEFSSVKKLWNDILTLGMKFTDNDVCCIKSNNLKENEVSKFEYILVLGDSTKEMLSLVLNSNLEKSKINKIGNIKIMPTFDLENVKASSDIKKAFWLDLKEFLKAI